MTNSLPEILTIGEAAQYLRISSSSLYKLAQEVEFHARKLANIGDFVRKPLIDG